MTTLTARDIPYEIKIRLDANGIRGAQYQTLRQWLLPDGTVDQEREGDVVPLALADDSTRTTLSRVLGEATATALQENGALTSALASANEALSQSQAEASNLRAQLAALQGRLAESEADQSLTGQQAAAIRRLAAAYTAAMQALIADYPEIETQSWTRQASDAKRHLAWVSSGSQGDAPATDLLSSIWAARAAGGIEETLAELAQKVVAKDAQYSAVVGTLTGRRHAAEAAILLADTVEAVKAVAWDFSLS